MKSLSLSSLSLLALLALLLLSVQLLAVPVTANHIAESEMDFDDDEFEGSLDDIDNIDNVDDVDQAMPPLTAQDDDDVKASTEAAAETATTATPNGNDNDDDDIPTPIAPGRRTYEWEIVASAGLILYALVYVTGRSTNSNIAAAVLHANKELLEQQFAQVGVSSSPGAFMKESQSEFKLFCSGRRFCIGMMMELQLVKRHDLISRVWDMFNSATDLLTLDIPMNDGDMGPFVFAIVRKSLKKAAQAEMWDLKNFAKNYSASDVLPPQLEVLTDCHELVRDFIRGPVKKALNDHADLVEAIHFTDHAPMLEAASVKISKKALRFQFRVPSLKRMDELTTMMQMAMFLVDVVGQHRMSLQAKNSAAKKRAEAERAAFQATHAQRQEELAAKKKAEHEAALKKMTPAQRAKREETERKRMMRKRGTRMKVKAM